MYLKKAQQANNLPRIEDIADEALASRLIQLGWVVITEEEYERLSDLREKELRISELKRLLANSDYISCKIAEGAATREEYAEIIAQRQAWRDEINELEAEN